MRSPSLFAAAILSAAFLLMPAWTWGEAKEDPRPCLENYEKKGNIMLGRTFATWQEFTDVPYDEAFRKVAQATAQHGWSNLNASKDAGTITAGERGGNISIAVIEKKEGVVRIEAKIIVDGAHDYSERQAKKALCASTEAPGN